MWWQRVAVVAGFFTIGWIYPSTVSEDPVLGAVLFVFLTAMVLLWAGIVRPSVVKHPVVPFTLGMVLLGTVAHNLLTRRYEIAFIEGSLAYLYLCRAYELQRRKHEENSREG